jgi:hypothetical protein
MSKENTLVLTNCFHYRKQLKFCDGVSHLRISKFPRIECKWLVFLGIDGSGLVFGGIGVDLKGFQREPRSLGRQGQLCEQGNF